MMRLHDFMVYCPHRLGRVEVRKAFAENGLGPELVTVWGVHDKIFIKLKIELSRSDLRLFQSLLRRYGAVWRSDYRLWIIRVLVN